jgi:hypothetical protein
MSAFWQYLQCRLHPTVASDRIGSPGKKMEQRFSSPSGSTWTAHGARRWRPQTAVDVHPNAALPTVPRQNAAPLRTDRTCTRPSCCASCPFPPFQPDSIRLPCRNGKRMSVGALNFVESASIWSSPLTTACRTGMNVTVEVDRAIEAIPSAVTNQGATLWHAFIISAQDRRSCLWMPCRRRS